MTSNDTGWADNPPKPRYGANPAASLEYDQVVEDLRRNPGKWRLVYPGKSHGTRTSLKRRGCHVEGRNYHNDPDTGKWVCDIWACWPDTTGETE